MYKITNLTIQIFLFIAVSCSLDTETIPLPEHPRPDFQRSVWQNLNGYWQFRADSADVGLAEHWEKTGDGFEQKILVPFSWASPLSEVTLPEVHIGWYYRTFEINKPKEWEEKRTWLNFCASDFNTTIWINDKKAGSNSGGYTPFAFDITEFLLEGENKVVVRVEDQELSNRPSGKQYYGNAKGIWQTVFLEARTENHISLIHFTPDIDKKEVGVKIRLASPTSNTSEFVLFGKENGIDFKGTIPANTSIAKFTIPIEKMQLWSLDHPFLYEVSAMVNGEGIKDEVSTYFGMRKISAVQVPGKDFQYVALNNEPIYMKLSLDQSYHPQGFYTFPSDQFMQEEILRAKALGLNGLRIHIKAEIPRKLYWADKLGLLIQEDIPNFWGAPDSIAKANWEQVANTEIERDYNHPSIFSWVLFNETWGLFSPDSTGRRAYTKETQDWVREWYHKTKAYDPTRLVEDNSPCNWDHVITDINTWHRYSPARHWSGFLDMVLEKTYPGSDFNYIGGNLQGNEPMFNSECGAVWGYNGSTGDIDITWEYHIMMNEFRRRPKIAGFLFTEFHDVINEWNGYYRFDRSNKVFGLEEIFPGMTMNDFHSDLYVVVGDDFFQTYPGGSAVSIPVGISAVTENIPNKLTTKYSVYGWNELGEKTDYQTGEIETTASPFSFKKMDPVEITLPNRDMVMILATELVNSGGKVLHRNFVPFRIEGDNPSDLVTVKKSPDEYTEEHWSIKHHNPQSGKKVWGMGSGFFEYEFEIPGEVDRKKIDNIEFRAELAARYPQSKYLEEGEAERIGMTIVSEKGTDNGYGKNSYPQTDEVRHSSVVKIIANDKMIREVVLADDPADHRGILSWMNQEPGWLWGDTDRSKKWELDEAGSFGYLVQAELDASAKASALVKGKVVLRLLVDDSSPQTGGLSIYGKNSGRYPMDLTMVISMKD